MKTLKAEDICQGANKRGDSFDILTWLDKLFPERDIRVMVEKALAREIGILSHGLIKWNDSTSKREVAETFNLVIKRLKKEKLI